MKEPLAFWKFTLRLGGSIIARQFHEEHPQGTEAELLRLLDEQHAETMAPVRAQRGGVVHPDVEAEIRTEVRTAALARFRELRQPN